MQVSSNTQYCKEDVISTYFFLVDKEDKVVLYVQEMPELIIIGIICGCVLFTFIVVIICFVLYRRQQKQYKLLYFMKMGNANYVV